MRIAIVSMYAGVVERGAEIQAREFKKHLPGEVQVYSLRKTDWTEGVPVIAPSAVLSRAWHLWSLLIRKTPLIYLFDRMPCLDLYSENSLECLSFGKHLGPALNEHRPDIVINLSGSNIGWYLKKYRARCGTPFINCSGAGPNRTEKRNAGVQPDVYVAQSPVMVRYIQRLFPSMHIELIPAGVDLSFFRSDGATLAPQELAALGGSMTPLFPPFILSTSAHDPSKGIERIIQAVASLPKGTLLMTSAGPETKRLLSLAQDLLPRRHAYLGVLPREKLAAVYRSSHVFCMASPREAFGIVLIEAMACGLPIVAQDDEDRRWIVGKAGVLTDASSVPALAKALEDALSRNWEGLPRAEAQRFSWPRIAEQFQKVAAGLKGPL